MKYAQLSQTSPLHTVLDGAQSRFLLEKLARADTSLAHQQKLKQVANSRLQFIHFADLQKQLRK